MTPDELLHQQRLQPKLQRFQAVIGVLCFAMGVLFLVLFNAWATIGPFFAAACQWAIIRWRKGYIAQIDHAVAAMSDVDVSNRR